MQTVHGIKDNNKYIVVSFASDQNYDFFLIFHISENIFSSKIPVTNKGNNKITGLRTILQRESQNS
jgi:hypothetical protein